MPPLWKEKTIQRSEKAITERAYPQFFPKGSIITKNRPLAIGRAALVQCVLNIWTNYCIKAKELLTFLLVSSTVSIVLACGDITFGQHQSFICFCSSPREMLETSWQNQIKLLLNQSKFEARPMVRFFVIIDPLGKKLNNWV